LITDGEVWSVDDSTALSETIYKNGGFSGVECHIINRGSQNLSVTCLFTRGSNSIVYTHNGDISKVVIKVTEEMKDMVLNIDKITVEDFIKRYDEIEAYIVSQCMGSRGNEKLRDLILNVKKRLLFEYSKMDKGAVENRYLNVLKVMMLKKD